MNISGLNTAAVLAALYNGSHQKGMGFLNLDGESDMTEEQARVEIAGNKRMYFDYLHGRVMKIDLSDQDVYTALYNRENGDGAAEIIIRGLRRAQGCS